MVVLVNHLRVIHLTWFLSSLVHDLTPKLIPHKLVILIATTHLDVVGHYLGLGLWLINQIHVVLLLLLYNLRRYVSVLVLKMLWEKLIV